MNDNSPEVYRDEKLNHLIEEKLIEVIEILKDAMDCPRLDDWEKKFISDIWSKTETYGRFVRISPKQLTIIERIAKEKVYASG